MDLLLYLVPIIFIIVALVLLRLRSRRGRPKAEKADHHTRQERAVWAWTRVVSSEAGPVGLGGMARVKMQLEVHLPGSKPYPAATTWLVEQEALSYVETGKEVPVRVDPSAPKYIYPNGSWAKFVE